MLNRLFLLLLALVAPKSYAPVDGPPPPSFGLLADLLFARLFSRLLPLFSRVSRVVNPADPTSVVVYEAPRLGRGRRRLSLRLVCSWGVEAHLTVLGRTWRSYDNRFFCWLASGLDGAHYAAEDYRDDPMARYASDL